PRAGLVGAGAAVDAEAHEHVALLDATVELLEEDAVEADVVRERADERGVVAERYALEALLAVGPRELRDVAREVACVRGRPGVAARVDRAVVLVRLEQRVDDAGEILAVRAEGDLGGLAEVGVDEVVGGGHRASLSNAARACHRGATNAIAGAR